MDQVANHVINAPSLLAFIGERPDVRQTAQKSIKSRRGALENRYRVWKDMFHAASDSLVFWTDAFSARSPAHCEVTGAVRFMNSSFALFDHPAVQFLRLFPAGIRPQSLA